MNESPNRRTMVAMYIVIVLFCMTVIAGLWDTIWWHRYVGRDTFFILPHKILYSAVALNLVLAISMWLLERTSLWRRVALASMLPVIAGPIDELWHTVVFRERADSVWVFWSPAHLIIECSFLFMFLLVLVKIRSLKNFYGTYLIQIILWTLVIIDLYFVLRPVLPLGTIYRVLGFWGAGPVVFVTIFMLMISQLYTKGRHTALFVSMTYILIIGIVGLLAYIYQRMHGFDYSVLLRCLRGGYRTSPGWLHALGWISTAMLLDKYQGSDAKWYPAIAGLLFGGLIYGISSPFLGQEFTFSLLDGCIAIVCSIAGGYLAGIAFRYWRRNATV